MLSITEQADALSLLLSVVEALEGEGPAAAKITAFLDRVEHRLEEDRIASFTSDVSMFDPELLQPQLRAAMGDVENRFPTRVGIMLMVFDLGGGGVGYAANARREDVIALMKDWIQKQGG